MCVTQSRNCNQAHSHFCCHFQCCLCLFQTKSIGEQQGSSGIMIILIYELPKRNISLIQQHSTQVSSALGYALITIVWTHDRVINSFITLIKLLGNSNQSECKPSVFFILLGIIAKQKLVIAECHSQTIKQASRKWG